MGPFCVKNLYAHCDVNGSVLSLSPGASVKLFAFFVAEKAFE